MSDRKQKRLGLLLVFVWTITAVLTGCQQSNPDPSAAPSSNEATATGSGQTADPAESAESAKPGNAYAPDASKTYKIAWLVTEINAPVPADAAMKTYWEEHFNVEFDIWYIERSNWDEILNLKIASGEFPDVIYARDPATLANYQEQGLIMELPIELLETLVPNITADMNKVREMENLDPWVVSSVDGKNYGIPRLNEAGNYHFTPIWRKDWLDNVGIASIPATLAEHEEAFYKFVNEDPDRNGKRDTYALSSGYLQAPFATIYGAFGYLPEYWAAKDGEMVYGGVQPEMKQALGYLSKWYKDKLINPEFITGESRGGHWSVSQDLIDGIIGYSNNGPFYQNGPPPVFGPGGGRMYKAFADAHENDGASFVIGKPAVGPEGHSGSVRWGIIMGGSLAFNKNLEKEPDKLGKILDIIQTIGTDYDTMIKAVYGLEGVHYTRDADGTYNSLLEEGKVEEDYGLGNVFWAYDGLGIYRQWDPDYYGYADKFASYTNKYTNMLYTRLPSESIYADDLLKLQTRTYLDIITGKSSLDQFDAFVETWYASGGRQLVEEANAWYDSVK